MAAHRRHDISDKVWANIEKLLPGSKGSVGRPSADNRLFINAVFWILRTGAPWRDLPPDLGDWKNTHRRFCRWRDRGVWEKILEALIVEPDLNGSSLMPVIAKYIPMRRALREVMRP